jgi:hypothetical protein
MTPPAPAPLRRRVSWRVPGYALLVAVAVAMPAGAQSTFTGSVKESGSGAPVPDAEIAIAELHLRTLSDAQGRFALDGISSGRFPVSVRKLGFDSATVIVGFSGADTARREFTLTRVGQVLEAVPVTSRPAPIGNAKLQEFERRRSMGIGRFLSEEDLKKDLTRRTGDILQKIPGTRIVRPPNSMAAYVMSARGIQSIEQSRRSAFALPNGQRLQAGLCPAAVFLDGVPVYRGGETPFDVNTIQATEIAAIEFYAGPSQLPAELNATRGTCGALVIWTK